MGRKEGRGDEEKRGRGERENDCHAGPAGRASHAGPSIRERLARPQDLQDLQNSSSKHLATGGWRIDWK